MLYRNNSRLLSPFWAAQNCLYKYIDEIITYLSEWSWPVSDQHTSMLCHYHNNGRSLSTKYLLYKYVDEIVIASLSECAWPIRADILSLTAHEQCEKLVVAK